MFSLFRSQSELIRQIKGLDDDRCHDRFNARRPGVNYDKFPRPIRPRKSIPNGSGERSFPLHVLGEEPAGTGSGGRRGVGCGGSGIEGDCGEDGGAGGGGGGGATGASCGLSALARAAGIEVNIGEQDGTGSGGAPPPGQDGLQSIAFAFSHLTLEAGIKQQSQKATDRSTLPSNKRQYDAYEYTALEGEPPNQENLEKPLLPARGTARGNALITCQYYLRTSGRYTYLEQLNDIGSRIDKYWFMVRDSTLKTDRMMTMVPYTNHSPILINGASKATLSELFLALQSNSRDDWHDKYSQRSVGLPESQIQRIGRQILEALTLLQDKGFPPFGHLHSGNVMIQNGVARLTGLENTMLGYTSRIYPMLCKRIRECRTTMDTICFGHILFEMAAAYELNVAHPTEKHLQEIQNYPQVLQVLHFIFYNEENRYPTIEELSSLDFFRNLDLREMRGTMSPPVFQAILSENVKQLLREVKRYERIQKHIPLGKLSNSTSSLETSDTENGNIEYKMGSHRNLLTTSMTTPITPDGLSPRPIFSGSPLPSAANSATATPSKSMVTILENCDVQHHLCPSIELRLTAATSPNSPYHSTTDDSSAKSTPYCSLLDVSCHLMTANTNINEEYHTPPTTPTVKTNELDSRTVTSNASSSSASSVAALLLQPNHLLQQCFHKIHETFEGAVLRISAVASPNSSSSSTSSPLSQSSSTKDKVSLI